MQVGPRSKANSFSTKFQLGKPLPHTLNHVYGNIVDEGPMSFQSTGSS